MSVETEILRPMAALYSAPFGSDDPAAVLEQYKSGLKTFTDDQMRAGWIDVRNSYKGKSYPSIALIREACAKHQPKGVASPKENVIRASYCFDTPAGQLALSESCAQNFLMACQDQKRVLSADEVKRMSEDSRLRRGKLKTSDDRVDREVYKRSKIAIDGAEDLLQKKYGQ